MIGHAIATLEYVEPSLQGRVPASVDIVAGCCWAGFRLLTGETPGVENLLVGKSRLPQFRQAKASELRRVTRYHFRNGEQTWQGDTFTVRQWAARWQDDAALRRFVQPTLAYRKWCDGLAALFHRLPLVACAEEADRFCYGAIGGDPTTLAAMHHYMEEGGIAE